MLLLDAVCVCSVCVVCVCVRVCVCACVLRLFMRNEPVTTTFHFIQHLLLVIGKVLVKKNAMNFS